MRKLLLAEDSPTVLNMAKKSFEREGFEVVVARDGINAIEEAYRSYPDAIILDLMMPRLNGTQTCRLLKENPYFKDVPIIMLTGKTQLINRYWSLISGADAYFLKPQGIVELSQTVQQITNFLAKYNKRKNTLASPKDIKDTLSYILDMLYNQLFIYTLKFEFTQRVGNIEKITELQQQTLKFLEFAFGKHLYFICVVVNNKTYNFFLTPFAKGSQEVEICRDLLAKTFFQFQGTPLSSQCEEIYQQFSNVDYKLNQKHYHSFVSPLCKKACGASIVCKNSNNNISCSSRDIIGVLGIISSEPLLQELPAALGTISKSVAEIFDHILIQEQIQALAPLKAYNKILQILASTKDFDTLLNLGLKEIAGFSNTQVGIFFLHKPKEKVLLPKVSYSLCNKELLQKSFALGEGLVGTVAKEEKHLLLGEKETLGLLKVDTGFGVIDAKGVLLAPVIFQEKMLGVLALGSIYNYSEETIHHTLGMVGQFAIAIHNSLEMQKVAEHQYKGEFLASMSHELRTPLNAMIGYTSLVLNDLKNSLPVEHLKNLTKAEQSARTLLQLINDVLDFSKIEADKMEVYLEEFSLDEIMEDCLITAEGLLINKTVQLQYEIAKDLPIIKSDYTRLQQIIHNLLSNAIKFTTQGCVTIRIRLDEKRKNICLEVEDTGCGMEEDQATTVFEAFKQMDGSIKKRFGGTGLGLAITKKLCELLDIQIQVQSKPNKGTIFWLLIPLKSQNLGTKQDLVETIAKVEPTTKIDVLCNTSHTTFDMIAQHLKGMPLEACWVKEIKDCIAKAETQPVWAIVLEPDTIGFDSLQQIKKHPSLCHIPVIMCCAERDKKQFQLGPLECITKPINKQQLLGSLLRITSSQEGLVLVVEDDKNSCELYGDILHSAGYQPLLLENGKKAIDFLSQGKIPQAIILDLLMPEMDGFEVLKELQANQQWSEIPVMIISGKDLTRQEKILLENGTQTLLKKGDFAPKELSEHVKSVVKKIEMAHSFKVLIVDDNPENLNLAGKIFEGADYKTYLANSGQKAIDMAIETLPDVILMDLAMPELDGFETTRRLKQHPTTQAIVVIACSAFNTQEFKNRAQEAGCEGYITKPIEPKRFVEQVKKHMLTSKISKQAWRN